MPLDFDIVCRGGGWGRDGEKGKLEEVWLVRKEWGG